MGVRDRKTERARHTKTDSRGENTHCFYNFHNRSCHAKIVPGENSTAQYNFGCEKCTGLAKSVPDSEKGPLAI